MPRTESGSVLSISSRGRANRQPPPSFQIRLQHEDLVKGRPEKAAILPSAHDGGHELRRKLVARKLRIDVILDVLPFQAAKLQFRTQAASLQLEFSVDQRDGLRAAGQRPGMSRAPTLEANVSGESHKTADRSSTHPPNAHRR